MSQTVFTSHVQTFWMCRCGNDAVLPLSEAHGNNIPLCQDCGMEYTMQSKAIVMA